MKNPALLSLCLLVAVPCFAEPSKEEMVKLLGTIDDRQRNNGDFKTLVYLEQKEKDKADIVREVLVYRRDASFDWSGPELALQLSDQVWRCGDDRALDVTARYQVERRAYAGLAFTRVSCPAGAAGVCVRPTSEHRADLRHNVDVELLYTGQQVLSARYRLTVNDSSSFGSSLYRHRLDLAATVGLPARLFATATLTGQLDRFPEPYLAHADDLDHPIDSIDDENRSGVAVRLARALSPSWQVEARAALFADLFPADGRGFHRQVMYLGLTWDTDAGP